MTVTLPLASSAAASTGSPPAPTTPMPERQIFEYAMEAQQAIGNNGGQFANPAALIGELMEHLRPFLEREHRDAMFPVPAPEQIDRPLAKGALAIVDQRRTDRVSAHRTPARPARSPSNTSRRGTTSPSCSTTRGSRRKPSRPSPAS